MFSRTCAKFKFIFTRCRAVNIFRKQRRRKNKQYLWPILILHQKTHTSLCIDARHFFIFFFIILYKRTVLYTATTTKMTLMMTMMGRWVLWNLQLCMYMILLHLIPLSFSPPLLLTTICAYRCVDFKLQLPKKLVYLLKTCYT